MQLKRKWPIGILFVLLLGLLSCGKDHIIYVDSDADDSDDYIENTTFDHTVTVAFSTSGPATVSGTTSDFTVSVSGNDVTIEYKGGDNVQYELSGTTTNGFFKLYSYHKQAVVLNGVNITNPNGAAISLQGPSSSPSVGRKNFVVLNGSNMLADGISYTDTPSNEDEKAALFAEGQLIFSGDGSLTVTATGKSGIASDSYVRFMSGVTVSVTSSAGHGIKGDEYLLVSGGTLNVETSADMKKGLNSDGFVRIDGGNITIKVTGGTAYDSEDQDYTGTAGVKADGDFVMNGGVLTITNSGTGGKGISSDGAGYFNGGTVNVTTTGSNYGSSVSGGGPGGGPSSSGNSVSAKGIKCEGDILFSGSNVSVNCNAHEGIESKGAIIVSSGHIYSYSASDDAINSAGNFLISGGYVCGYATSNDGLDANGNFYINGGVVYAIGSSSPEVALDANTEGGYKLYVQGGTIIAIGGLENGFSANQSCYSASSWSTNTWYALTVGSTTYAFKTPSSAGSPLVVSGSSTPTLLSAVSASGGSSYFNGMMLVDASVSGGTSISLSSYSGGGSGGGPGGGSGGGPGGGPGGPGGGPGW